MRLLSAGLFVGAILVSATAAGAQDIDWEKVDAALGRKGAVSADVHRYGFPRSDLTVKLDGVTIKPALALGGWVAFKPMHGEVMGDLVLLETEVNPVMAKLIENGIEITCCEPIRRRSTYTSADTATRSRWRTAVRTALAESKTPLEAPPAAASAPAVDLDVKQLDEIVGAKGRQNGGVYQFSVPRREAISEDGMAVAPPGPMGVATGINFQPTGGGKAAITGDFVLAGNELNPVIKTLRENGIQVTALHSHMLTEEPRLLFMHFWANDDAVKLARGLHAALEKMAIAKD